MATTKDTLEIVETKTFVRAKYHGSVEGERARVRHVYRFVCDYGDLYHYHKGSFPSPRAISAI